MPKTRSQNSAGRDWNYPRERDVQLALRFTQEERALIRRVADAMDMSLSDAIVELFHEKARRLHVRTS